MSGEFQFLIEMAERGNAEEKRLAMQAMAGIQDAVQQAIAVRGAEFAAQHGYVVPPEVAAYMAAGRKTKAATTSWIETELARRRLAEKLAAGQPWKDAIVALAGEMPRHTDPEALAKRIQRSQLKKPRTDSKS